MKGNREDTENSNILIGAGIGFIVLGCIFAYFTGLPQIFFALGGWALIYIIIGIAIRF